MTVWASPAYLSLLIPLAAAVIWRIWQNRKKRPTVIFSQVGYIQQVPASVRARLRWLPMFLKVLALFLAILALARPQRTDTKIKRNAEGIDIMICWDISDSMLIEDMPPDENRMDSA